MKLFVDPMSIALLAEFDSAEALTTAAHALRASGYERLDAYVPYPIDELEDLLNLRRTRIPWIALGAGLTGAAGAYALQWFCNAYDYPLAVGGRPLHSGLAFVPITFETTILCAALATFVAFFMRGRLPEPWAPMFDVPGFDRASIDRFFLGVDARDARFDESDVRRALAGCHPLRVVRLGDRP
jgi:hypothetical protein